MRAADLTVDDIGAEVTIPHGRGFIRGQLTGVREISRLVELQFTVRDVAATLCVKPGLDIIVTVDHLKFRAVIEPNAETRARFYAEINRLHTMALLREMLGGDR